MLHTIAALLYVLKPVQASRTLLTNALKTQ